MKRINFIFVLILLSTAYSGWSQSSVWKVTGNGQTLYIGGTIHILREQDFPLPPEYDHAYHQSDVLVFEADAKAAQSPEVMTKIMQSAIYGGDTTLQTVLSKAVYDSLKTAFDSAGMSIALFNKMKASMVVMTLTAIEIQKMGFTASGVDMYFYNKGEKDQKTLLFLETLDQQIHLLVRMGEGNEDQFVRYSLMDIENIEGEFKEMLREWRIGSGRLVEEMIEEMKSDYPGIYRDLLINRNNEWMKAIPAYLETDEVEFILVGDLHLYGKEGLLARLKNKGYTVEQVEK